MEPRNVAYSKNSVGNDAIFRELSDLSTLTMSIKVQTDKFVDVWVKLVWLIYIHLSMRLM
jgi:hypothetical protein